MDPRPPLGPTNLQPKPRLLILRVTFVILFAPTGSLVLPLKATVLNLLSVGVMFGVLTAVFQNGFLADAIGFTPVGTLDPAFPILMFCVVYGLSMDYEVFMVSRIREEYERTGERCGCVRPARAADRSACPPPMRGAAGAAPLPAAIPARPQTLRHFGTQAPSSIS